MTAEKWAPDQNLIKFCYINYVGYPCTGYKKNWDTPPLLKTIKHLVLRVCNSIKTDEFGDG